LFPRGILGDGEGRGVIEKLIINRGKIAGEDKISIYNQLPRLETSRVFKKFLEPVGGFEPSAQGWRIISQETTFLLKLHGSSQNAWQRLPKLMRVFLHGADLNKGWLGDVLMFAPFQRG